MAAVPVTITGMYTKDDGSSGNITIVGLASITGLGVGGGPIIPPTPPNGQPPNFPNVPPHPAFPIAGPGPFPPGEGYPPVVGGGPIYPPNVPPSLQPPTPPNPGDPTTIVPPPAGSGGWPVQPIAIPPYIIVNYPGLGPVYVAQPVTGGAPPSQPTPQ
jgi:hypothetical protein